MGRKSKYTYEELKLALISVAEKHPTGKITITLLGEETEYPAHIWKYDNRIKADLDEINNIRITIHHDNDIYKTIPNFAAEIEKNYKNKEKVIAIANRANEHIDQLVSLLQKYQKSVAPLKDLQDTVDKLKQELITSRKNEAFYKQKFKETTVKSTSSLLRKKNKIEKNLIDINSDSGEIDDNSDISEILDFIKG